MSAEHIRSLLCSLSYPERIAKCTELLLTGDLDDADQVLVRHFLAHAYRQPEIDMPHAALRVANEALAGPLDAEFRGKFLEVWAMSLHDMGHYQAIPAVLAEAHGCELLPSVRGHMIGLQGLLLARERDTAAFQHFEEAEQVFVAHNVVSGVAWVQLSAAELALRLANYTLAREWARRVQWTDRLPLAKLLEAEALYRGGNRAGGIGLANQVGRGDFGAELEPEARAQSHYLQALFAVDQGDVIRASLELAQANECLSRLNRRVIELADAIGELASRVRREGVA